MKMVYIIFSIYAGESVILLRDEYTLSMNIYCKHFLRKQFAIVCIPGKQSLRQ